MRIERKTTIINRPWNQLAEAINQKYPNPHSESARCNDVINRHIDSENRLVTEKFTGNNFPVPSIIRTTFNTCTGLEFPRTAYNYELSVVDLKEHVFRQYARNNTMTSFLNFVEVMEYKKLTETETQMTQTFHVGCTINSWFDGWFEGQFMSMCRGNSTKGLNGLEWVTEKLNSGKDGIIDLEGFREGLKEFYSDCEQLVSEASDKILEIPNQIQETTGEITKAVTELYEKGEQSFDDIKKKTIDTTEDIVGKADELASTVDDLKHEMDKNVTKRIQKDSKRIRYLSETIHNNNESVGVAVSRD
jgi:methyl-accepting chemotaxis protein